ncbi:hypothetical protein NKH77_21055 [Streptomyces sp. M19]
MPFGPEFVSGRTNDLITPLLAAILGLGLNEAAYMAEIVRGGLLGVDQGQSEAAVALGMGAPACCAGSSCRRPCGSSCRPPAARSSTCSRPPRW